MNEQFIPGSKIIDDRRVGRYVLYKTDTFLCYRRFEEDELINRHDEEEWYFEFNHRADPAEVRKDFALFLKRFRPERKDAKRTRNRLSRSHRESAKSPKSRRRLKQVGPGLRNGLEPDKVSVARKMAGRQ
jgi:hypothetical protein